MRSVEIPKMQFSPWRKWENRRQIQLCNKPGIYLLAISSKNLEEKPPEWEDVSYIGMTNSRQGLLGRWQQFFNAIRGKTGHSGGNTVFAKLGHYETWSKKLYVAAMPIECNVSTPTKHDLIRMGWVAYLEYEAFAEYKRHCPERGKPPYNTL